LLGCDLGERIGTATIVIDQTSFLDGLRRRMDDIANGKAENFNSTLADALKGTETLVDEIRKTSWPSLRTGQQALLRGTGRSRRVRFHDGQMSGLDRQSTALERPSRDLLWIKRTTMG